MRSGRVCIYLVGLFGLSSIAHTEDKPTTAALPNAPVTVSAKGNKQHTDIVIRGRFKVPTYNVKSFRNGTLVVIEVTGTLLSNRGIKIQGDPSLVLDTSSSTTAQGVRINVTTRRAVTYHARADLDQIVIRLEPMTARSHVSKAVTSPGPAQVQDVHLERRDGRDRVIVELNKPVEFRVIAGVEETTRLELPATSVSSTVQKEIQGARDSLVKTVRVHSERGRAIVEVAREHVGSATVIREGKRIVWLFAPTDDSVKSQRRSRAIGAPSLPTGENSADGNDTEAVAGDQAAGFVFPVPLQTKGAGQRAYIGRRIDLDFKDADIHNILRLLAEVGGVNVITSDDVTGAVTIRMRDVPWDQALELILQSKGLGMVRRGNIIRVAPLTTLEKEAEMALARSKQREQLAPLETRLIPVSYATAEELQPRINELLSARGSVSVDARTNVLVVRDLVENLQEVESLVRSLDTQTPQVLVEARIVEATSQYSKDVGIQWGGDVTMASATGNPTGLAFPSNITAAGGNYNPAATPTQGLSPFAAAVPTPNFAVNLPATVGDGQGGALGMSFGSVDGNININVRLSAAEANGVVRIVSSPRILTLDNHQAHIAQGTLIPYSQVSAQGVQTAFQEAKLQLAVRPHVTSDGSVAMHVKVTRDEPDFTRTGARGDPAILKREAETDLLLDDGHTAVIGGIYTRNTGHNVDQVPFFGDIPILGLLFQRRRVRDERSELLIFLTPRIVNRSEALKL
ncbi:MAG: type IV pilus secretin PilQ [Myxococcales bacterium]|nr:type IV pilus secretin PilQ [Myxococcales bacterium]MCB9708735.1 type IV pilus secretin PilQ [Myxococcales bacterium]